MKKVIVSLAAAAFSVNAAFAQLASPTPQSVANSKKADAKAPKLE